MSGEEIRKVFMILLEYLGPTLKIFGFTLLYSIPLGMIVALLKMCRFKPISWLTNIYILIMRGTPLMLQIIVAYYAVPMLKQNDKLPEFIQSFLSGINIQDDNFMFNAIIVAFSLNYAAYFAEIFRGGIESIPKGQYEAGAVLGLTKTQVFFKVVLLQVIKRIIPPMGNEFLTLVKDTSLANTIMIYEITWNAKRMMNSEHILWPLFYSGVFYLALCGILTLIFNYLEKKLDYYKG